MSVVGWVTMLLGLLIVASRGPLLVWPARLLGWFQSVVRSEAKTRVLGVCVLGLGGLLIWAGDSETSALATALGVIGWAIVVVGALGLVLFPRVYMGIAEPVLPTDLNAGMFGWRIIGMLGVLLGGRVIWFG